MNSKSLLFLFTLCPLLTGCGSQAPATRGKFVPASVAAVRELAQTPKGKAVQVTGVMVEKCPVAGCWFILKDKTGTVRVDTKSAGFVVSDLPLQTPVTVTGTVAPGDTPSVSATGLQTP